MKKRKYQSIKTALKLKRVIKETDTGNSISDFKYVCNLALKNIIYFTQHSSFCSSSNKTLTNNIISWGTGVECCTFVYKVGWLYMISLRSTFLKQIYLLYIWMSFWNAEIPVKEDYKACSRTPWLITKGNLELSKGNQNAKRKPNFWIEDFHLLIISYSQA